MPFLTLNILIFILVAPSLEFANINNHSNMLISKHLMKDYTDYGVCLQEAVCIPLQNATCFGTPLPYTSTSLALAEDSITQFEVQDNLALWQGLRSIPRCWAVVQPFLCAVYMPKCDNGSIYLPSQEMCRITRGPCKSVEVKHSWPSFLQCENKKLFPPRCKNPLQEVKFNTSYKCMSPLVETDNENNWYHEVKGCGIQCQDPLFTTEEHDSTHNMIIFLAATSFTITLFTVLTFAVSWKAANTFPAVITFYINVCLAIVSFVWLIQFIPGARKEIVCAYDGTIRRHQPMTGEHLCSITFFLMYYFLMASVVWFVILAYSWHILFKQTGTPKDIVKKKVSYFHISAWSIPLILTTAVMAMNKVDGDSMSGICFVGYANMTMRIGFLLVPIGLAALIGGFFLVCALYALIKLKLRGKEVTKGDEKKVIERFIWRIGLFSAFTLLFTIGTFVCHAYDFLNRKEWDDSLRDYIVCLAMNSANTYSSFGEVPKCSLKSKPSVVVVHIHILCLFGYAIISALLGHSKESLEGWKCFFYRLCEPAEKKAFDLERKIYYLRRAEIAQAHLSVSLNSTHDDPAGINLDANSKVPKDISLLFSAALPQFVERRNAIAATGPVPVVSRQYSSASDMSRHLSMDSFNQPNLDSLSLQMSEEYFYSRQQRRKTRRERERLFRANRMAPWFPGNRRGSDTSLQSSLIVAKIAAGVAGKVTKATSTGDLGMIPLPHMIPSAMMSPPVNNRPHIQRQPINPPFTHGMTDNSHRLDGRVPSVASGLPTINSGQRFTPSQCSILPNSVMGMVRQPMYRGSYDVLNSMSYNYFAGGMYPNLSGMYPGYPFTADYMYNPYAAMQYTTSFTPCDNQYQQDILPMNPIADSASETEFFPIRISDSEYTDTGMRSYDESQLMTAQRLMQEHMQTQAAMAAAVSTSTQNVAKPALEPQKCAKTQLLKRTGSFQTKMNTATVQTSRPPSDRKSPHSEAPPPSPVGSDNVFNDEQEQKLKNSSRLSLSNLPGAQSIFNRIRSKFRRSTSFAHGLEKPVDFQLPTKPCSSSLVQLSETDFPIQNGASQKKVLKEKCLDVSEGTALMTGDIAAENVSR